MNSSAMFLIRFWSMPKLMILFQKSLSLSCASRRSLSFLYRWVYLVITLRRSVSFSWSCFLRLSLSFSRLASLTSQQSFIDTQFLFITTRTFYFSSQIAAHDYSCMVSMKPALRPSSCCNDLFYLARYSISFCFLKLSFSNSVILPLSSWHSLRSYQSGSTLALSSISLVLLRLYSISRLFLKSLNSWSLAFMESRSILSCDFRWLISSSLIAFSWMVFAWIDWIQWSFPSMIAQNLRFSASKNSAPFCFCSVSRTRVWEVSSIFVPRLVICSLNSNLAAANLTFMSCIFDFCFEISTSKFFLSSSFYCNKLQIFYLSMTCASLTELSSRCRLATSFQQNLDRFYTSLVWSCAILTFSNSHSSILDLSDYFSLCLSSSISYLSSLLSLSAPSFISLVVQYSRLIYSLLSTHS